jgi:hypothetical protein
MVLNTKKRRSKVRPNGSETSIVVTPAGPSASAAPLSRNLRGAIGVSRVAAPSAVAIYHSNSSEDGNEATE